jgi:hypothetical protein
MHSESNTEYCLDDLKGRDHINETYVERIKAYVKRVLRESIFLRIEFSDNSETMNVHVQYKQEIS